MSRYLLLPLLFLAVACGSPTAESHLETAQSELSSGNFDGAVSAAATGLAAGGEKATLWRLELIQLEAQARGAKTEAAVSNLGRLATTYEGLVTGSLYVTTAGQLKEAGDGAGGIQMLDAGKAKFPNDGDVAQALEKAMATADEGEKSMLEQLGYLGD